MTGNDDSVFAETAEQLALYGGMSAEGAAVLLRDVLNTVPVEDQDGPPWTHTFRQPPPEYGENEEPLRPRVAPTLSVWGPGDWLKPPLYIGPPEPSYGTYIAPVWRFRPEPPIYGTCCAPPGYFLAEPWEPPDPLEGTVFSPEPLRAARELSERLRGVLPLTEELHRIQRGVRHEIRGLPALVLPQPLLVGCFPPATETAPARRRRPSASRGRSAGRTRTGGGRAGRAATPPA